MSEQDHGPCSVCSVEAGQFIMIAPWGEIQEACSLDCLDDVVKQWRDHLADSP